MTKEEKAEEYAIKITDELRNKGFLTNGEIDQRYAGIAQGVLYGLAEGKPKWHDLRKNPEDLPPASKEDDAYSEVVLSDDCEKVYCSLLFSTWFNYHTDRVSEVIAWTTLPKFEEE